MTFWGFKISDILTVYLGKFGDSDFLDFGKLTTIFPEVRSYRLFFFSDQSSVLKKFERKLNIDLDLLRHRKPLNGRDIDEEYFFFH